jgi:hypothetical protein
MTKNQRLCFMLFFVLLFLIIGPLVVLFAQGYRFDKYGQIFVYSGSITIKSWPRDIDIYIDGKKQDKGMLSVVNNSYTINSIRPGKYNLKCQKDGYSHWEKNVEVHSGVSTEFWNILLFPKEDVRNIRNHSFKKINQYFISPRNKNEIVFFTEEEDGNKVYLVDTEKGQERELYSTNKYEFLNPAEEENVEWNSNNKKIIIPLRSKETKEKIYLIASIKDDQAVEIIDFNNFFNERFFELTENNNPPTLEKIRWMFDEKEELVVLTEKKRLYYVSLDPNNKIKLLDENVLAFDFAGNRIYYCQSPNKIIWEIKDKDSATKKQIIHQSIDFDGENSVKKMIVYDEYRIALLDKTNNLIVYNEEKEKGEKTLEKVYEGVRDIQFSDDGKKLLFWTNNEIRLLMLRDWEVQPIRKKNNNILITRFSETINNVQWMDNYENIIFSVNNSIKSSEIDIRDRINIVDIMKTDRPLENRQVFYNKENQTLYFIDQEILKSLKLIDKGGILGF